MAHTTVFASSASTRKSLIDCPMGFSVEVAGWNTAVSYLYSNGLDLTTLVQ